METKRLRVDEIELAGTLLRVGDLVAIPTETVYGLGANGLAADVIDKIYEAKGRPSDNPLILHVPNQESIKSLVKTIQPLEQELMDAFWPGPLTITFEKSPLVPLRATGGLSRVALRCPDHDICRRILEVAGVPIAAPSANLSGRPSPTTADAVLEDMNGRIHAVVDGGPCEIGVESTVVQVEEGRIIILRPGGITREMLEMVCPHVEYDKALLDSDEAPKAPGMKYRHYAPDMPVTVFVGNSEQVAYHLSTQLSLEDIGFLISEETKKTLATLSTIPMERLNNHSIIYGKTANPKDLANHLYESLLTFNKKNISHLYIEGCTTEGLGAAVMNRLEKASANHIIYV